MRISAALILLLFVFVLPVQVPASQPEFIQDVKGREPELAKIHDDMSAKLPKITDFAGRTYREYYSKEKETKKALTASLPADTRDFVYEKLKAALAAQPPDLPVVWLALWDGTYTADPRIYTLATKILNDLSIVKAQYADIAAAAMQLLVESGVPQNIEEVTRFLDIAKLQSLQDQGYSASSLGVYAICAVCSLPYETAISLLMTFSGQLAVNHTETNSDLVRTLQFWIGGKTEYLKSIDNDVIPDEKRGE